MVYQWAQSGIHGGGFQNCMDVSPFTDGVVLSGCDVGGFLRSVDHGGTWITRSKGLWAKPDKNVPSIKFYRNVARNNHKVIAFTGVANVGSAKCWLSTDEGLNWSLRSAGGQMPAPGGNNNAVFPGLPPTHPRSVGRLIAIDESTTTTYIYAAGHHNGVWRSSDDGTTWTPIGLQEAGGHRWYIRTICLNPGDATKLLVGTYGVPAFPGDGGAYQLSGIRGTAGVTKIPTAPNQVEEIVALEPVAAAQLYAACGDNGIYRLGSLQANPPVFGDATRTLTKSSAWCSISGVVGGGGTANIVYAGCANPANTPDLGGGSAMSVCVVKTIDSGNTWSLVTNDSRNISNVMVGTSTPWWHASLPSQMLGHGSFVASQIVVNPLNTAEIYVAGRAGIWRSVDSGIHWAPAVNKMNVIVAHAMRADPSAAPRAYAGDTDWGTFSTIDRWASIVNRDLGQGGFAANIDASLTPASFYVGGGNRDTNDGGEIQRFVNPIASGAFSSMGLGAAVSSALGTTYRPMGLAINNVGSAKMIVAAVDHGGIWRHNGSTWSMVVNNLTAFTADMPNNAEISVVWLPGSPFVFVYDKMGGVWRSSNNGSIWQKIWSIGHATFPLGGFVEFTGYMCGDPTLEGRLYVSSGSGLYRVNDARTGSVDAGTITPVNLGLPRSGNLATDATGGLFVVQRPSAAALAAVQSSTNQGATFTDVADDVFRQAGMFTTGFSVGAGGELYASQQGMGVLVGIPGAPAVTRTISVVGIPTSEAIGTPTLLFTAGLQGISLVGISSAEAIGVPTLTQGPPPVIDTTDAYFLPPVQRYFQPKRRLERMGIRSPRYQALLWTYRSNDEDDKGGITIGSTSYRGGYWTGPLSTAQVAEITAAGLAARIRHVNSTADLPPNIE